MDGDSSHDRFCVADLLALICFELLRYLVIFVPLYNHELYISLEFFRIVWRYLANMLSYCIGSLVSCIFQWRACSIQIVYPKPVFYILSLSEYCVYLTGVSCLPLFASSQFG